MKVLVIDDYEGFREAIRGILVKHNHSVDNDVSAVGFTP
jgi:DNA-binding NarL/FixJ family response regulator